MSTTNAPLAVITGGQGALGQALSRALRADGWDVRSPGRSELDVTCGESVRGFFAALPGCRALILNAGTTGDSPVARLTPDIWEDVMATNLRGAMACTRAALPMLLRTGGGHIVFIGSRAGLSGAIGQSAYAASKAALVAFSASMAREYGAKGIQSNVVLPGWMDTPMTRRAPAAATQRALDAHTLGRFTTTEESARFIAFLLTCKSISGQIFHLDSRPGIAF